MGHLAARSLALFVLGLCLVCPATATTIAIDGVNDFAPADTYATSTVGATGFASFDATNLYLGYDAPDVASSSPNRWLLAYLGAVGTATTSGAIFNTQQATLPFSATHLVRWRADGAVSDVLAFDGSTWSASAVSLSLIQSGSFVELAIPLVDLGAPVAIDLVAFLLSDQTGFESTYAGMPATALVDGYDPQVDDFLHLALPEPGAGGLLALGLAGIGAGARSGRRRRP